MKTRYKEKEQLKEVSLYLLRFLNRRCVSVILRNPNCADTMTQMESVVYSLVNQIDKQIDKKKITQTSKKEKKKKKENGARIECFFIVCGKADFFFKVTETDFMRLR